MKKLFLFLALLFLSATSSMAATYYASPSGGGAASCVDNGANVCTLARAVVVAGTGTHTIESATGTYSITTELSLGSGNTGANLTFTCAGAAGTCIWGSTGSTAVVDIEPTMVSGTLTFSGIEITDNGADYSIRNQSPEVDIVFQNGIINNTDASVGTAIYYPVDTTNLITLVSGEDTVTGLRTGATTNVRVAQKIVPGANITVNRGSLKLKRRCGNTGTNCDQYISGESWDYRNLDTLTLTIETDSAGAPSGTPVTNGTSSTVLASSVPYLSAEWVSFSFASNVSLTSGTTYWVVLKGSYTASTTNYIEVSLDTTDGYAGGDSATWDGTTWTTATGSDYVFTVDRAHTRTFVATGNTMSTRSTTFNFGWANTINISNNTSLTSTAASLVSVATNNQWTTADKQLKKLVVANNAISVTTDGSRIVTAGVNNFSKTYVDTIIIKGNTGVTSIITQPWFYVRRLLISDNVLEVQYAGNCPLQLGRETDGSDPAEYNFNPFEQIVIEGNYFSYTSSAHNHLMLFAIGAENGILRNNTIVATNGGGGGRAWGIVIKAAGWLVEGNKIYGVAPAVAVYGTNNTRVVYNTLSCFGSGGDGCILVRNHQDSIYGPTRYGKGFYNYIKDNIIVSDEAFAALDYGFATTDPYDPAQRDPEQWSNIIDNNIYYASTNTNYVDFEVAASQEYITSGEGVSTLQGLWTNTTYTDTRSLSAYNDLNSQFRNPALLSPSTGNFVSGSGAGIGLGTISGTNIGGDQVSGGGGGSTKMGLSL